MYFTSALVGINCHFVHGTIYPMKTLHEYIQDAEANKIANRSFNISNMEAVGNLKCCSKLNVPVIIGVSEGERDFFGVRQIAAVVRSLREEFDIQFSLMLIIRIR